MDIFTHTMTHQFLELGEIGSHRRTDRRASGEDEVDGHHLVRNLNPRGSLGPRVSATADVGIRTSWWRRPAAARESFRDSRPTSGRSPDWSDGCRGIRSRCSGSSPSCGVPACRDFCMRSRKPTLTPSLPSPRLAGLDTEGLPNSVRETSTPGRRSRFPHAGR
jgi:hypothetical protein